MWKLFLYECSDTKPEEGIKQKNNFSLEITF